MATYKYYTQDGSKVQVESAIRDGEGKNIVNNYAKQNGYYSDMGVGSSDQLISTTFVEDKVPYNFRTSGGNADIGNRVKETALVGGSLVWNQLQANGNFASSSGWWLDGGTISVSNNVATITYDGTSSNFRIRSNSDSNRYTAYKNHKYLIHIKFKASVALSSFYWVGYFAPANQNLYKHISSLNADTWYDLYLIFESTYTGFGNLWSGVSLNHTHNPTGLLAQGDTLSFKEYQIFDLTQMFGSTIADYIYTLESNTTGEGVSLFRNLFPLDYYEYNAGTLLSTRASQKISVGFNAFDYSSGTAKLVGGNQYQITGTYTSVEYTDINGDTETLSIDNDGYFTLTNNGTLTITGGDDSTTCVHLVWSGYRDDEFEEYAQYTYDLGSDILRGIPKLDSDNNLYYYGDTKTADGTITRKFGIVDLGTLTWNIDSYNRWYSSNLISLILASQVSTTASNIICSKYMADSQSNMRYNVNDKTIGTYSNGNIAIYDTAYPTDGSVSASDFATAMSGVLLIYELATETTETGTAYQELQIVDDFGTEEFVCIGYNESTQSDTTISIPCGHDSDYYANLRDKLQRLPDMPDSDGYYVVKYEDRQCSFYDLSTWLSANGYVKPTELSGYDNTKTQTLKNVSGVFTWVDDE